MLKSQNALAIAALLTGLAMQPALAADLRGDAFITALNGNTLVEKTADGKPTYVYFLPGGQTSYQAANGQPHFGHWKLDRNNDVCITWAPGGNLANGCFKVTVKGDKITFANGKGREVGGLAGTVESAQ